MALSSGWNAKPHSRLGAFLAPALGRSLVLEENVTRTHAVGTIVAANYIAQARVLARSFTALHPDVQFYTLIIDGTDDDRRQIGLGAILLPTDLGLDDEILNSMRAMYDVMEYATALKPAMLMYLHRTGALSATYFDPDIRIYDRLLDVFEAAATRGIVLTPHAREPFPRDDNRLNESDIMHAGIYNLGFIATGPSAYRFLAWWHDHLKTEAIVDLSNALFTDQRWIDWAPAIETPLISRDSGLNAAYWNLHEREIRDEDGRWFAGDRPLRFFHFSGYDPAKPWLLSKHMGDRPRTLLSEHEDLRRLCDSYGEELNEFEHVKLRKAPYGNGKTPDGLKLNFIIRRLYRDSIVGRDPKLEPAPNPFSDAQKFSEWLLEPSLSAGSTSFSRFDYAVWRIRSDVQRVFPDPFGNDADNFRHWLDFDPGAADLFKEIGHKRKSGNARTAQRGTHPESPAFGWSLIGYARAELGVGEAGRRLSQAFAHTGFPWEMVGVSEGPLSRQQHAYRGSLANHPKFTNTVLCANADQTALLSDRMGLARQGGRRVGYWFWELEAFPTTYERSFEVLDEIWVSSEFNRVSIAQHTDKPVRIVPLPIAIPDAPTRYTRRHFGLPQDKTIFLANFDYLSVMARKNPLGAIRAYTDAFGPDDGACLVVKSINGHLKPLERERVRLAANGRSDILFYDQYMTSNEMRALTELVDCYVSVHRSEGFGLNLADAMALGTPVIATGYSGNLAFMTKDTSFLIPHKLVKVGPGAGPYDPEAVWAEPHLTAASKAMRTVFDKPSVAQAVADRARRHIEQFSVRSVAAGIVPLLTADLLGDSIQKGVK